MSIPLTLISIGLITLIASFFLGNQTGKYSDELEKVSISLHQETSVLKKRLKAVEEELMISTSPLSLGGQNSLTEKPVHEIIVNQILSLNTQGFSVDEIAKRSSLTNGQVLTVLRSKGVI